ncbi:sulfotransferase family protein [Parafilimonas terrae]|uniref:Sulfotransferase domain-containing protein n=1 Tax=Parafilimonas terrae TaxID=1465490 RepID=A0A1I5Z4M9_9BACT|nr:sulfotransferase [Parafilimonas terrae]SFQ51433.1 Sulfotransferase domain-containing protein [Parafilimonas terrae]
MENKANLFIVGAAKCGTTSLYEYLSQHPEIYMSPIKEPHFFSDNVKSLNKDLYRNPVKGEKVHTRIIRDAKVYASLFEEGRYHKIRGDASPSYLWDVMAAQKIYNYNNEAKIIIMLRNPVKRLISQYQMAQSLGIHSNKPFLELIKEEFKKKNKIWGIDHIYIDLGFYHEQVARYTCLFPSSQILILKFEDFITNKRETLNRVFTFLAVDDNVDLHIDDVYNSTTHPKYAFIKRFRRNKFLKKIISLLGTKKALLKEKLFTEGYDNKIVIDEKAIEYLENIYGPDLQKLREDYNIQF